MGSVFYSSNPHSNFKLITNIDLVFFIKNLKISQNLYKKLTFMCDNCN